MRLRCTVLASLVAILLEACAECGGYRAGTVAYPTAIGEEVQASGDLLVFTYTRPPDEDNGIPYEAALTDVGTNGFFAAPVSPRGEFEYAIDLRQVPPGRYGIEIQVRQESGPPSAMEVADGFCTGEPPLQPDVILVRP